MHTDLVNDVIFVNKQPVSFCDVGQPTHCPCQEVNEGISLLFGTIYMSAMKEDEEEELLYLHVQFEQPILMKLFSLLLILSIEHSCTRAVDWQIR